MTRFNGGYTFHIYISNLVSRFPSQIVDQYQIDMFSFCFFVFLTSFSIFVFSFSIYKKLKKKTQQEEKHTQKKSNQNDPLGLEASFPEINGETDQTHENKTTQLTHSARSLLLEILPSDTPKWESLFENEKPSDPDSTGSGFDGERSYLGGDQRGKKKKKRSKKKNSNSKGEDNSEDGCALDKGDLGLGSGMGSRAKEELVCLYPFTSSSSVTQRKIKQQYDELMKCHQSKGLTLAQVLNPFFLFKRSHVFINV